MDIEKYLQSSDEESDVEEQGESAGDERLSPDEEKAPEISSRKGEPAPFPPRIAPVHSQSLNRPYQKHNCLRCRAHHRAHSFTLMSSHSRLIDHVGQNCKFACVLAW